MILHKSEYLKGFELKHNYWLIDLKMNQQDVIDILLLMRKISIKFCSLKLSVKLQYIVSSFKNIYFSSFFAFGFYTIFLFIVFSFICSWGQKTCKLNRKVSISQNTTLNVETIWRTTLSIVCLTLTQTHTKNLVSHPPWYAHVTMQEFPSSQSKLFEWLFP